MYFKWINYGISYVRWDILNKSLSMNKYLKYNNFTLFSLCKMKQKSCDHMEMPDKSLPFLYC